MRDGPRVTVFNFPLVEDGHDAERSSHFKATRATIEQVYGSRPIEATAEDVDASEVDADGTYRKLQSEWGSLD